MFSKISRYRKVPDVVVLDTHGRLLSAKDIRLTPTVTGDFRHTVNAGERLDQLAEKYYGQPLQWWHISDANPEFLSPLALLGDEAITTTTFPVAAVDGPPSWDALFGELAGIVGVEDVAPLEEVALVAQEQTIDGTPVTVWVERYRRAVCVTYNRLNVTVEALADRIAAAGFTVGPPEHTGRVGHEIVIPPKPVG